MLRHCQSQRPQQDSVDDRRFTRRYLGVGNSVFTAGQKFDQNLNRLLKEEIYRKERKVRKISSPRNVPELKTPLRTVRSLNALLFWYVILWSIATKNVLFPIQKIAKSTKLEASLSFSITVGNFGMHRVLCGEILTRGFTPAKPPSDRQKRRKISPSGRNDKPLRSFDIAQDVLCGDIRGF